MDILQELKEILSRPTPTSDALLSAFRQWKDEEKKKELQIWFIDNWSEDEKDSPWNIRPETAEDSFAILRFLTLLEIYQLDQREQRREKVNNDRTSQDLIASVADVSFRCSMGGDWRETNSRMNKIIWKCPRVKNFNIGPLDKEPPFSDPLWVANEIVRAWIEGSSAVADEDDSAGRDPNTGGQLGPGGEVGTAVTIGKIVHFCPLRPGSVGTMPTRLEDLGINLAAVAACFGGDEVVQFHMQR
ncbi:hypothetical protein HK104_004969, partial [Borealophlyctis nickersoniae]